MLWTLSSEALRRGAGQLSMTWFPRCTPERRFVVCGTRSTGGSGGLRLPHAEREKAKVKRQKAKVRTRCARRTLLILPLPASSFVFCLFTFGFFIGCSG